MKVKTLVEFSGVPKGTTAKCVKVEKPSWNKKQSYKVTWDLPRSKPLIDWFDKDEFDEYLVVVK